jgi:hypothetical protein
LQADGFRAFSNTIQGEKSTDEGKKRGKTMTHRLENFKDIDPLLEHIGDARWSLFLNASRAETLQAPAQHIDTQVEEQMNEINRADWKRIRDAWQF